MRKAVSFLVSLTMLVSCGFSSSSSTQLSSSESSSSSVSSPLSTSSSTPFSSSYSFAPGDYDYLAGKYVFTRAAYRQFKDCGEGTLFLNGNGSYTLIYEGAEYQSTYTVLSAQTSAQVYATRKSLRAEETPTMVYELVFNPVSIVTANTEMLYFFGDGTYETTGWRYKVAQLWVYPRKGLSESNSFREVFFEVSEDPTGENLTVLEIGPDGQTKASSPLSWQWIASFVD